MSAAPGVARARRAIGDRGPLLVLAAAVYVPLLLTAPGRVGGDTKNYLYLDPSRLLSRAWSMWDPNVGFGTIAHQTISYLWPMGPWFWTAERLGLPDWLAQRLWLGTIRFAAGAGTWWLLRRCLGWGPAAAAVPAFAYALTPYTLALAARISALLLPFAGLPWLIGLTILAVRRGGWRHPALFALVVATIGSVNATALVLAGLGPLLWLAHVRFVTGEASTRQVLGVTGRIGVLTTLTSLWWVAGLWVQGGWGIDILRYTETAETVSSSSSVGAEVLRGLGYWFFYGGDRLGQWIEPGTAYTQNLLLIGLTFALPVAALARTRFAHRSFFVTLVVVGLVAAVGAHPWDDPSALGAAWKAMLRTDTGLALRSLPAPSRCWPWASPPASGPAWRRWPPPPAPHCAGPPGPSPTAPWSPRCSPCPRCGAASSSPTTWTDRARSPPTGRRRPPTCRRAPTAAPVLACWRCPESTSAPSAGATRSIPSPRA